MKCKRLAALILAMIMIMACAPGGLAEEKEPRLGLTALVRYPKESYALNPFGITNEIPFLVTVTNSGEAPCPLQTLRVKAGNRWYACPIQGPALDKGQSFTCLFGQHLYPDDLLPDTAGSGTLGTAEIIFIVTGGENGEYVSNEEKLCLRVSDEITDGLSPDGAEQVLLSVDVTGASVHPAGYQAGEKVSFQARVQNRSSQTLPALTLWEINGSGENEKREIGRITDLAPGEEQTPAYVHTITEADLERGYLYSAVSAAWDDPDGGKGLAACSVPAVVMTLNGLSAARSAGNGIRLILTLAEEPANGRYFTPGETARLSLRAANVSSAALYHVALEGPDAAVEIPSLLPGEETEAHLDYTVTELDALAGVWRFRSTAQTTDVYGNQEIFVSNSLDLPTGPAADAQPAPEIGLLSALNAAQPLTVLQREISSPAQGGAYRAGETIEYEIIVFRGAGEGALDVWACSSLDGDILGRVDRAEQLEPGDFVRFSHRHTVTEEEEKAGCVVCWAFAEVEWDGRFLDVYKAEAPVISPAGNGGALSQGGFALPLPEDGCHLTLLAKGTNAAEYSQDFCARHASLYKTMQEQTAAAETEEAQRDAWDQAAALWTKDLETLYGEYLAAASGAARMAVMQERSACMESLESLRALLDQAYAGTPAQAARVAAEEAMRRCLDLCGDGHTAPEARTSSIFRDALGRIVSTGAADACGRMTLLSQDGAVQYRDTLCDAHSRAEAAAAALLRQEGQCEQARSVWLAALQTGLNARCDAAGPEIRSAAAVFILRMDRYLAARAETLALLYPDDPQSAAEAAAQAAMRCVLALCREEQNP